MFQNFTVVDPTAPQCDPTTMASNDNMTPGTTEDSKENTHSAPITTVQDSATSKTTGNANSVTQHELDELSTTNDESMETTSAIETAVSTNSKSTSQNQNSMESTTDHNLPVQTDIDTSTGQPDTSRTTSTPSVCQGIQCYNGGTLQEIGRVCKCQCGLQWQGRDCRGMSIHLY